MPVSNRATGADVHFNHQTSSYTLVSTDVNKIIEMETTETSIVTIPSSLVSSFTVGACITIVNLTPHLVTISGADGVVIRAAAESLKLNTIYAALKLFKRDVDTWYVFQDTPPHTFISLRCCKGLRIIDSMCLLPSTPVGDVLGRTAKIWRDEVSYWEYADVILVAIDGYVYLDLHAFPYVQHGVSEDTVTVEVSYMEHL